MSTILSIAGVVLPIILIWIGLKKPDLPKFGSVLLWCVDLMLLIQGIISLGRLGVAIVVVANVIAAIIWGLNLAITQEDTLARAAVSSGTSTKEMQQLQGQIRKRHRVVRQLGPLQQAELIRLVAQKNRSGADIEPMMVAVATLYVAYRPDIELEPLVDDFDHLLRSWNIPPSDSMRLADRIASLTKNSPGTVRDSLDALKAFHANSE